MDATFFGFLTHLPKKLASPVAQMVKNLTAMQDLGFNPWVRKISWEVVNPLQYSYLKKSMDRGARWAKAHGVTNGWTQ